MIELSILFNDEVKEGRTLGVTTAYLRILNVIIHQNQKNRKKKFSAEWSPNDRSNMN